MGPAKTIPMNAIMIYMSGNGVQIFSVMITAMLFWQPIKAIFSLNQSKSEKEAEPSRYFRHSSILTLTSYALYALAFERFEPTGAAKNHPEASLLTAKATFLGLQLVTIALGIYKVNGMGLLPTTTSDWLAFMSPKQVSTLSHHPG